MPKRIRRVERANALDVSAYQDQYVGELDNVLDASHELKITFASAAELAKEDEEDDHEQSTLEQCFRLLEASSADDYKGSSVRWSPSEKRKEMRLPDLRYLVVRQAPKIEHDKHSEASIQAFTSFMLTYEDGYEVMYIYEIHICEALRGKGIGSKLLALVEEVGRRAEMSKVMLTVFATNQGARKFYVKLGYEVDEFSPPARKLRNGVVKEPDYQILSKALAFHETSKRRKTG